VNSSARGDRRCGTTLSIGAALIAGAASVAWAAGLTEQLPTGRMTVLKVDRVTGQFLCAEHGRWTPAARQDLQAAQAGDVVKVEPAGRLVVLRTAAEELSGPEK
jgi:hypothetical protein